MPLLSGQALEPAANVVRQGTETASVAYRLAPATAVYPGGSVSLPALSIATVWGTSGAQFDVTVANYVGFIEAGSSTYYVVAESGWPAVQDSATVVGLDYITLHTVEPYQPRQFGSKSISGGAIIGTLTSQSVSGGGTFSGRDFIVSSSTAARTDAGTWVMVGATGTTATLIDYEGGGHTFGGLVKHQFFRITLVAGAVKVEGQVAATTDSATSSTTLVPGTWYWVVGAVGILAGPLLTFNVNIYAHGQLVESVVTGSHAWPGDMVMNCVYGWGVDVSSSGAGNFPDSAGWGLATNVGAQDTYFPYLGVVPNNESFATNQDYIYNCRQPLGPISTLLDSSGTFVGPGSQYIFGNTLANVTPLAAGTYDVAYTWTNGSAESSLSAVVGVVIPVGGGHFVTDAIYVPTGLDAYIYVSDAPGSSTLKRYATASGGASVDITAVGSGASPPSSDGLHWPKDLAASGTIRAAGPYAVNGFHYTVDPTGRTDVGFWFEVPSLPASTTTLDDYDGGGVGYFRIGLTAAGHLRVEGSMARFAEGVDSSTTVSAGAWYFVVGAVAFLGGPTVAYHLDIYDKSGVLEHLNSTSGVFQAGGYGDFLPSARYGFGVTQTTNAALSSPDWVDFPNAAGWYLSKDIGGPDNLFPYLGTLPTADATAGGMDYIYNCRQPVGTASVLIDSSGTYMEPTNAPPVLSPVVGSTALIAQVYYVAYTWLNAAGESNGSGLTAITLPIGGCAIVVGTVTPPAGATGVNYYMSVAAASTTLGYAGTGTGVALFTISALGNGSQPPPSTDTAHFSKNLLAGPNGLVINLPGPYAT